MPSSEFGPLSNSLIMEDVSPTVMQNSDSVESDPLSNSLIIEDVSPVVRQNSDSDPLSNSLIMEDVSRVVMQNSDSEHPTNCSTNKDVSVMPKKYCEVGDSSYMNKGSHMEDDDVLLNPICDASKKPHVGMHFSSVEEGYQFYQHYASCCGFDIRRGTETKHRGTTIRKHFYCTKAGRRRSANVDTMKNQHASKMRKRMSYRTCCPAYIKLKWHGNLGYIVAEFIEGHNHEMSTKAGSQFLKSHRKLHLPHKSFIVHCSKVNMGATKAYNISKELSGGFHNVGAQRNEFKNFARDLGGYIGDEDAQMVIEKLVHKKEMHSEFFFEYVEEDGVLSRLFLADPISIRNFYAFGDVVSFDATYGTNKYEMIFVPFTGVDNNKKSVTFAAGLLTNEEYNSYVWLLEAFAKCMGRHPKVVLTDEDPSLKRVVLNVFPEAHHRFCMWHIMKKFSMKVGCNSPRLELFRKKLKSVVYDEYIDTNDFEQQWHSVLEEYEMTNNKWLNDKFHIREFWIPAYFRDVPLGGRLKTTSRSESINSFFGRYINARKTLVGFFFGYETALESQRHKTLQFEHEARFKVPKALTPLKIEEEAMKVYTYPIFCDVQDEIYGACFNVFVQSVSDQHGMKKFMLKDNRYRMRLFEVIVDVQNSFVNCSCKLFERIGYLCRHAFFGLRSANIDTLPTCYVLPRWTKNALTNSVQDIDSKLSEQCDAWYQTDKNITDAWMEFQSCMSIASTDHEKLRNLVNILRQARIDMQTESLGGVQVGSNHLIGHFLGIQRPSQITVRAPNKVRTKGCGRRIIGDHEKALKKAKPSLRRCKTCGEHSSHDSRNCPLKKPSS